MNNKAKQGLWMVVGAYLAYTGVTLVMGVWKERPDNYQLMIGFGVVFVMIGAGVVVRSLKNIMKPEEEQPAGDSDETEEDEIRISDKEDKESED